MLSESGYITGVSVEDFADGTHEVDYSDSRIMLAGLKYHAENSIFLRAIGALPELLASGVSVVSALK